MTHCQFYHVPISPDAAIRQLKSGQVVAIPTETVYGLAGIAASDVAVARIFEAKSRPRFNPLVVHCADFEMAQGIGDFSPLATRLARRFWPGPLTLVVPKRTDANLSALVTAGLETVAIRLPVHPVARHIIAQSGAPLAAPSANPSGKLSPTQAQHVIDAFEQKIPVVDGGICVEGVESSIVGVDGKHPVMLRPGSLTASMISEVAGVDVQSGPTGKIIAPGMTISHYAPNARVRLNADSVDSGEAYLGFGAFTGSGERVRNLSVAGDLREAARNLFRYLRELDHTGVDVIAVAPIPDEGIGVAINDRLKRAAADRNEGT